MVLSAQRLDITLSYCISIGDSCIPSIIPISSNAYA